MLAEHGEMEHVSCQIFPFVRGATLFSSCGRTVFLLFWRLLSEKTVHIPSDRRTDEAVDR